MNKPIMCYCGNNASLDVNVFNDDEYSCRVFCEDCELSTPDIRACHLQQARENACAAWALIVKVICDKMSELF